MQHLRHCAIVNAWSQHSHTKRCTHMHQRKQRSGCAPWAHPGPATLQRSHTHIATEGPAECRLHTCMHAAQHNAHCTLAGVAHNNQCFTCFCPLPDTLLGTLWGMRSSSATLSPQLVQSATLSGHSHLQSLFFCVACPATGKILMRQTCMRLRARRVSAAHATTLTLCCLASAGCAGFERIPAGSPGPSLLLTPLHSTARQRGPRSRCRGAKWRG